MTIESEHAEEQYCYLTTTGRKSGEPREIEIWFGARGNTIYMLSGNGPNSHWVMNIMHDPRVTVRIADETYPGTARIVEHDSDEERAARLLLAGKYQDWQEGKPLSGWARTALPVAVDLSVTA